MKKIAVVTGGSKGIGLAIVEKLLNQNYQVFNLDISKSDIGEFIHCDISKVPQVINVINNIIQQTQQIDVLISTQAFTFRPR